MPSRANSAEKDTPMRLLTSESVTEGHPDKLADQISDAVLDAVLELDPMGRVACETLVAANRIVLAGEITTDAHIDYEQVVRTVIREVGYTAESGLCPDTCAVDVSIIRQSPEIAAGVGRGDGEDRLDHLGAGDQGIMFGYACQETPELMPLPIQLAHALVFQLARVRKNGMLPYLRPDGKSQVTVSYEDGPRGPIPRRVETVVIAAQHDETVDLEQLRADVREHVVAPVLGERMHDDLDVRINTAGPFTIGGPAADAGLTGRKIIVDTYGGAARHGGGAFSGKDPSKVDRSAAYMARHAAAHVVAADLALRCEIQLGYAIGQAAPVSVRVDCFGTNDLYSEEQIEAMICERFDMRPQAIIDLFDLRKPIYRHTAAYGHMGRPDLPWG
jgi:S-adenosylmethionine synthetase